MSLLDKVKQLEKTAKLKGTASHEKRPRHYAAEIIALNPDDRPAALAALEQVPIEHRPAVAQYLEVHEIKRNGQIKYYTDMILELTTRVQRNAVLTTVPDDVRKDVEARVVAAYAGRART